MVSLQGMAPRTDGIDMDVLKANFGICISVIARIDAWQGWPDGKGTNTYAVPREHAAQPGIYWIPIKEVYGPKGKVMVSDIVAQLEAAEVAAMIPYEQLEAEGAFPIPSV